MLIAMSFQGLVSRKKNHCLQKHEKANRAVSCYTYQNPTAFRSRLYCYISNIIVSTVGYRKLWPVKGFNYSHWSTKTVWFNGRADKEAQTTGGDYWDGSIWGSD